MPHNDQLKLPDMAENREVRHRLQAGPTGSNHTHSESQIECNEQPRPQPTDQRFQWLARLATLCFKILALLASRASIYSLLLLDSGLYLVNQ